MSLHGRLKAMEQHPTLAGDDDIVEVVEVGPDKSVIPLGRLRRRPGDWLAVYETYAADGSIVTPAAELDWDEEEE
jgi:hypothetical protein